MRKLLLAALVISAAAVPANATIVYSNNFDTENGGVTALNYSSFNGLTVTDGSVDLVHTGDGFGIICPNSGCVDLDGSTSDAGVVSSNTYGFGAGQIVSLNFQVTGNQRGGAPDNVEVFFTFDAATSGTFGFASSVATGGAPVLFGPFVNQTRISLPGMGFPSNYPLDDVTFFFTAFNAGNVGFGFRSELVGDPPAGDNIGLILDNVALDVSAVPEPASWAMMIAGFGLAGAAVRRRTSVKTAFA